MPLAVDVTAHRVRFSGSRAQVANAARATLRTQRVRDARLSITFVSAPHIAALNRKHLGHRGSTDVISFGFRPTMRRGPVIGDIYIAPAVAHRSARVRGIAMREEIIRLVVHGTLHILGFDHPEDERRMVSPMWTLQERVVRRIIRESRP